VTGPAESTLLAAVEQSPQAAAAHDRAAWVGLFTTDGRIEDPVGSRPHVGPAAIGRFYDTFIGPRDIAFHRDLDIVHGPSVVRDLDLEVVMGAAVTMTIPAFLRYDLREISGEWKIAMLRAYWELPSMMLQFLRNGASAVPATLQLSQGLIRNQRLRGTVGFAAGFRRVGSRHKKLVDTFVNAIGTADRLAAQRTLSSDATMTFGDGFGDADALNFADLVARCPGARAPKLIAAGSTVAASITSAQGRGVLFADVARRRNEIRRIRYFPASSTNDAADSPK
jgi:Nuclear transport factor 2 (NTF2) domain